MMSISRSYRYAVLLMVFATAVTWGLRADAQDQDPVQRVVDLNKKALAAYANLDVEDIGPFYRLAEEIESDVLELQRKLAPADSTETS